MGAGRVGDPPPPRHGDGHQDAPRRRAAMAGEIALSLALVLLCFFAFTAILTASFPGGARLADVLGRSTPVTATVPDPAPALATRDTNDVEIPTIVAELTEFERNVKSKAAQSVAWGAARLGQKLADRDAVQTLAKSTAELSFGKRGNLVMGENSLVVVRMPRGGEDATPRARLMAVHGELRGRILEPGAGGVGLEIGTTYGASVVPVKGSGSAEIKLVAGAGGRSHVMVYDGTVEVETKLGKVRLPANHYVALDSTGKLGAPTVLPAAPVLVMPADGAQQPVRRARGEMRFGWTGPRPATEYHLVVASDPKFKKVIYDGRIADSTFAHTRIQPGRVHWKVSTIVGVVEGRWSATRTASLVPDRDGPPLEVVFPKDVVLADTWTVEGSTEPGSTVRVGGEIVAVDADGRFRREVHLEPGVNVIVIQAIDAAGNVAYASEHVTARY